MNLNKLHTLGIDIGSTTVKIAILDSENEVLFSDYERHFANIQETLSDLLGRALYKLGSIQVSPVITGSGGLDSRKTSGKFLLYRRSLPYQQLCKTMHRRLMWRLSSEVRMRKSSILKVEM